MKDFTEAVKAMSIQEAIRVAMDAEKVFAEDADLAIAALLKLTSINSNIEVPLKLISDELLKMAKKQGVTIDGSAAVKVYNPIEQQTEDKNLEVIIGSHDIVKTETDFKAIQSDNGIDIVTKTQDTNGKQTTLGVVQQTLIDAGQAAIAANVKGVIVADNADALKLFKAPTIPGNPTAFAQKLSTDNSFGKYQNTKTDKKYEMGVSLTPISIN